MAYDYVEHVLQDGEDDLTVIDTYTQKGYTLWLTTMNKDRKVTSISFRKVST